MQFKLQLLVMDDDGQTRAVQDLAVLNKEYQRVEHLGLTLAESKAILKATQAALLEQQVQTFLDAQAHCPHCGAEFRLKGHHPLTFRTLFGNFTLNSPRWRACRCQPHLTASFSPLTTLFADHTAPELRFMETKWASLVSYGLTVRALQDLLPVDEKLNAATVRNHTLAVAERCEAELGDEQVFFVDGCERDWQALPPPDEPITVGMDGGLPAAVGEQAGQFRSGGRQVSTSTRFTEMFWLGARVR